MGSSEVVEELTRFIGREFLNGKDEGLDATTPLLELGIIDSFAIVALAMFIEERFGVRIPNPELKPANLATLEAIAALVVRLRGEAPDS
jgi:acyl carrier protein